MAMTGDRQGHIWVGTEDQGVWRFDRSAPIGKQWTQFNAKNGLGDDNCYALTCDRLGRIWAGTLNHGVSVFNGKDWKTYGPLEGPLGSRVFALTTSPKDGDVWMSTEAGLARYSLSKNLWSYYTRAEGLPSDQAQALAFDRYGTLYVGTDCDGIAVGSPTDGFKNWRVIPGPATLPNTEHGLGLPSGLINALLVAHDGTVYAGTTAGLATSVDGETWEFQRGADWQDKQAGLYHPVAPVMKPSDSKPLSEDYVTSLAEDAKGQIWVGHRTKGYEVFLNNDTRAVPYSKDALASDYLETLFPLSGGQVLLGKYGGGLTWAEASSEAEKAGVADKAAALLHAKNLVEPLPVPAKLPTLSDIKTMITHLAHISNSSAEGQKVMALDDDWVTHGTWVDHYGNFAAILCAMNGSGNDQVRGYEAAGLNYSAWIGRNGGSGDYLRYWVQNLRTEDTRSLQNMLYGGRKEAEWDDHGETKPMTLDGPNVYCTLNVPKGIYFLSCYDFNKDGHYAINRWRDYTVNVKIIPQPRQSLDSFEKTSLDTEELFEQTPTSASSRIVHFWGGVWKRFYINVPDNCSVVVQVKRNYSWNTTLCGVFLDPYEVPTSILGQQDSVLHNALLLKKSEYSMTSTDSAKNIVDLMKVLLVLREANPEWYSQYSRPYLLTVIRCLFRNQGYTGCLAEDVERFMGYRLYRQDLSAVFHDVQDFHQSEMIYSDKEKYLSWDWDKLNQAWAKFGYDHSLYSSVVVWNNQDITGYQRAKQVDRLYRALAKETE